MVERKKLQMTVWRMRVACWVSTATRAKAYFHALAHPHARAQAYAHTQI